jgi:hypothetical protein
MPITTYAIPKVINLVLDNSATSGANPMLNNYPFTRTDFNIMLNITNTVSVFVKDISRQPVALTAGQSLAINLVDFNSQTLLLTRALTTVDPIQGLYSFTITSSDSLTWQLGPLSYTVTVNNPDGTQGVLWTDLNYTPFGYCGVIPGPIPSAPQPIVMNVPDFVITDGWATSPQLPGSIFPNGAQTFAYYMTAFSGCIYIQGTLELQPRDLSDWFQIETIKIDQPYTGVYSLTTSGNYSFLRTQVPVSEFILDPSLMLPIVTGVVNQIIYKN